MFAVALLLRLAIAPEVGFKGDLNLFQAWAHRLAKVGPHRFYAKDEFVDYPPGYLYALWLIGKLSATPGYLLLKLPAILADLGLGWVAGIFAGRLAPASLKERWPVRSLVMAAVLFNPAIFAESAVWGQVDAVPAVLVLASLLLLFTGRPSLQVDVPALLLFAVAVAIKPQSGFVLPVMLYALYRRHVHGRPREDQLDGLLGLTMAGLLAVGVWAVSGLPFGLGPVDLVRFYNKSASVYPVTSANAFNLWGVIGFWRPDSTGHDAVALAGISAARLGVLLFLAGTAFVIWRTHRAIEQGTREALALTIAAAAVALLAYVVLTRMHERYMFMSLAILAPLAFIRQLRLVYTALSALFILNLWYPFTYFNAQWKSAGYHVADFHFNPWFNWLFGGFATDTWQKKAWSLAVTAIVLVVVWRSARWASEAAPAAAARHHADTRTTARATKVGSPSAVRSRSLALVASLRRSWALRPSSKTEPNRNSETQTVASRWGPLALVGLTCAFSLVILRGETLKAANLNDSAFHLQMVRWASGQISKGRVPLDGWYPYLSLGSSQFHHYQSLPHTLTAYTALLMGAGDQTAYLWILYLLLALWPIAVYAGARLFGWDPWIAAAAAAVSPLIVSASGYGYEHGSYVWQGYGVYSQLWGMWMLPIAWGLTWRAVTRGRYYAAAALALALTMAFHFITGYLAVLTVGVWVLVAGRGFVRHAVRAGVVVLGSVLIAAWVLVPLIGDTRWTTESEFYTGTIFNDSYGAQKVLSWLFRGQLFDYHRFPVVTLLVAAGIAACISEARTDLRARALLGAFGLSLLLFFGRATWGGAIDLLPGAKDVQMHRFVMGVHLAGILLAGVGLGWLLRSAYALATRGATSRRTLAAGAIAVSIAVVVLAPAWTGRARYDRSGASFIRNQQAADATDGRDLDKLIDIVKARGDGRVYAGLRSNWGKDYRVGSVPVHAYLADQMVDAIGFTFRTIASLSTDPEASFDETNPADYQMFNVRYLILPSDHRPSVPARLLASRGRHRLWEVRTTGYLQVVDREPAVTANRTDVEQSSRSFMHSALASRGIYPGVAFAGGPAPAPTFTGDSPPAGPAGKVLSQSATPQNGIFSGSVHANRPAVVLLKATYDRRWTATVDGEAVQPVMMAPSLVGVRVPAGRHVVRFVYKPYGQYPLLLAIGAFTLLGLAAYPRRDRLMEAWPALKRGAPGPRREIPSPVADETVRQ
jgi:Gpi18-like mannosyltransferase